MSTIKGRYLQESVEADLAKKMVFIGGPRQVGKTTLAKTIGRDFQGFEYLNWDSRAERKKILSETFAANSRLMIFDELHKYRQWKNYIKGLYDTVGERFRILVTGSARLDVYRRGGDSLLGRYHYYRLHPFSVAELSSALLPQIAPGNDIPVASNVDVRANFNRLLLRGGFPEPLFTTQEATLRRWHNERADRLIKEDIRDIESVRDLSGLQYLVELLPSKVGSLFSLNGLREDLGVAHKTVALWAEILERFYYLYRVYPFHSNKIKMLRKEPKMYLWDWSEVTNEAARLENMVGSHLLKLSHFLRDRDGYKIELTFLRTPDGREVDFLLTYNGKPWVAVEVKSGDREISPALRYFKSKLNIPYAYQLVLTPGVNEIKEGVIIVSADLFLGRLV